MKKFLITAITIGILLFANISNAAVGYTTSIGMFNEDMLKTVVKDTQPLLPGDTVVIFIASDGGYVHIQEAITAYLKSHSLKTVCEVSSYASSAAAILLTHCDVQHVTDEAEIMFHLPYVIDKNGKKMRHDEYVKPFIKKNGERVAKALGMEKYKRFLAGEDVLITGKEFKLNMEIK